jgi:hypothetical protein
MSASGLAQIIDPVPSPYQTSPQISQQCTCFQLWGRVIPHLCPVHGSYWNWQQPAIRTSVTLRWFPVPAERPDGEAMRAEDI